MVDGQAGAVFAVWAPNARAVSVIGNFNGWNAGCNFLHGRGDSGIWDGFIPGIRQGELYKFAIQSRDSEYRTERADPYAFFSEIAPKTASVAWDLTRYQWNDNEWMRERKHRNALESPISIYEIHLGSWRRVPEDWNRSLSYRELAAQLPGYLKETGFTHVELLPVMEHPFGGSWGYQPLSYFAPTSRFGTPDDFMHLVDTLHQHGIGVILDWVPAHFPNDEHGLAFFDGTHLYEHSDPRLGTHPDWGTVVFNYGRNEVRSFLFSSANFWLDKYHIDGLRVDAVSSMLYLDYSRKAGEWVPNKHGGRENLEAIHFLRQLNTEVYSQHPDTMMIAEESTAWPMVSRPTYLGGLGFGFKWNMGWMHDLLDYMSHDPVHRSYHQNSLTFGLLYAFQENFILPFSHDEVVHQKGSLWQRMPGDDWQKAANLRLLYSFLFAHPGKKLLFMGAEFGQIGEWNHDTSLDWHLLNDPLHDGIKRLVTDLNYSYRQNAALYSIDFEHSGFRWIDCSDASQSIVSFLRLGHSADQLMLAVFNFTPIPKYSYRLGVPCDGYWEELINTDAGHYGGGGIGNLGGLFADHVPMHGQPCSLNLTLPPLGGLFLKPSRACS